jgi:hypothetical protein
VIPNLRKNLTAVVIGVLVVLLLIVGYSLYQFRIAHNAKLNVPSFSFPVSNVYYRYSLRLNGITAAFGGQNMSLSKVISEVGSDMKRIKSAGFSGVRLGFVFQSNNYLADQAAIKASEAGLYPIGTLGGSYTIPRGQVFTPQEMTEWQNYVRNEVSANKNIIYFWEIWGEPSINEDRYGSPEEFVQLLKVTYPIIKKANPNAKVIVTLGAEAADRTGFDDQVLALGGGNYFDDLSFHPYAANPYLQEDRVTSSIAHEKALLAKYGNHWPLVITEIGQPASEVGEAEQARLAKFLYTEAAKNKIPVTWFYWSDEHLLENEKTGDGSNWGLIRFDGTERPILTAIKEFLQK